MHYKTTYNIFMFSQNRNSASLYKKLIFLYFLKTEILAHFIKKSIFLHSLRTEILVHFFLKKLYSLKIEILSHFIKNLIFLSYFPNRNFYKIFLYLPKLEISKKIDLHTYPEKILCMVASQKHQSIFNYEAVLIFHILE